MSDAEAEAGPSTAPLFKKRAKSYAASRISTAAMDGVASRTGMRSDESAAQHGRDDDISVHDLVELRSLVRRPTGIELNRLNKGDKRRAPQHKPAHLQDERWQHHIQAAALRGSTSHTADNEQEESDDDNPTKPRRRVRKNHFQSETGTVDVDKHMMAYIEQEIKKRTGTNMQSDSNSDSVSKPIQNPDHQLYAVAEKYRELQRSIQPEQTQEEREGNVALSSAMLSSIPEVDLGIDNRMHNIQQTELARRKLHQHRTSNAHHQDAHAPQAARGDAADQALANARFQHSKQRPLSDPSARQQMATDQLVLDRFRKRQRNFR